VECRRVEEIPLLGLHCGVGRLYLCLDILEEPEYLLNSFVQGPDSREGGLWTEDTCLYARGQYGLGKIRRRGVWQITWWKNPKFRHEIYLSGMSKTGNRASDCAGAKKEREISLSFPALVLSALPV
jgi:hypothetical protein